MKPRMTTGLMTERDTPDCPHCGAHMDEATVSLGELLSGWPLPAHIKVERDGYTWATHNLVLLSCPSCGRPSALAIQPGPADTAKLVAARTEKDLAYAHQQVTREAAAPSPATQEAER